jgi:hypothetical protein
VLPEGGWVLQGVALTRLSAVLNALVMAGLVWAGALSFKRVVRSDSAQLVYCMQARAQRRARPLWLESLHARTPQARSRASLQGMLQGPCPDSASARHATRCSLRDGHVRLA